MGSNVDKMTRRTWPAIFQPWRSGRGSEMGGVECCFNSKLSTQGVSPMTNATLTIYLRLHLERRDAGQVAELRKLGPGEIAINPNPLRDWGVDDTFEFSKFREQVKKEADEFWNNRFCLVNVSNFSTLDVNVGRTTIRPNVDCRFEVVWSDWASAHQVVKCFCAKNSSNTIIGASLTLMTKAMASANSAMTSWSDNRPVAFPFRIPAGKLS